MENLSLLKNLAWDNTLTTIVIWAIPVTLLWFCVKLYRFCSASSAFKKQYPCNRDEAGEVRPNYLKEDLANNETSEWLEYTSCTTGIPGVPPGHRE